MCEDTDVCHKFMKEVAPHVDKFSKRKFDSIGYSVNDEVFVIKVSYCQDQFDHLKQEFVQEMIEELKKSELYKHCWATHCVILCEEIETPDEYFLHAVKILVERE